MQVKKTVRHTQAILSKPLTRKQRAEIDALVKLPANRIDTSDAPEVTFTDQAAIGKFYRPIKKAISVRVDMDILAWLKQFGPGYQSRINEILRREMLGREKRR